MNFFLVSAWHVFWGEVGKVRFLHLLWVIRLTQVIYFNSSRPSFSLTNFKGGSANMELLIMAAFVLLHLKCFPPSLWCSEFFVAVFMPTISLLRLYHVWIIWKKVFTVHYMNLKHALWKRINILCGWILMLFYVGA